MSDTQEKVDRVLHSEDERPFSRYRMCNDDYPQVKRGDESWEEFQ